MNIQEIISFMSEPACNVTLKTHTLLSGKLLSGIISLLKIFKRTILMVFQ